jgi:nickel transport protein
MSRRCIVLTLLLLLLVVGSARAHRLDAEYKILPDNRVRIECWFERGPPPKAATVRVERADGSVLVEDKADSDGVFEFTCDKPQALKVIVDAGDGHRVELSLADPSPPHHESFPWGTVLLGIGLLLVPAAVVLGLRIWRQRI